MNVCLCACWRTSTRSSATEDGPREATCQSKSCHLLQNSVLFSSLAVLDPRVGHTPWTYFLHLSLSSVILVDSSTDSPVHVLMLSIQAVRVFLACVRMALFLPLLYVFLEATPSLCDHRCDQNSVGSSCTTNSEQIDATELGGYSRPTCNKVYASSHDALTVAGVLVQSTSSTVDEFR